MTPIPSTLVQTDAGLASQLRVSVARLTRRLRSERDPENQLSISSLAVLGALMREGEMTVGTLAAHERIQPPSMTRTVTHLEEAGYVTRRQCADDGRIVLVDISDKGRRTLAADRRRRDAWLARGLKTLTAAERDVLRRATPILERLANTD